jgi:hypothetical protein
MGGDRLARSEGYPQSRFDTAAARRIRLSAEALCSAVERRMDELLLLVEEETEHTRAGKLFAIRELEPRKARAAREFIAGLEAVKRITPALERYAPETMHRLRTRHSEFRALLQLSIAALETAKQLSDDILGALSRGRSRGPAADEPEHADSH